MISEKKIVEIVSVRVILRISQLIIFKRTKTSNLYETSRVVIIETKKT